MTARASFDVSFSCTHISCVWFRAAALVILLTLMAGVGVTAPVSAATGPVTQPDPATFVIVDDPAAVGDDVYRSQLLAAYDQVSSELETTLALERELIAAAARLTDDLQPTAFSDFPFTVPDTPISFQRTVFASPYAPPLRSPQLVDSDKTLIAVVASQAGSTELLQQRSIIVAQLERLQPTIDELAVVELYLREAATTALRFETQKAEAQAYVLNVALTENARREASLEAAAAAAAAAVSNRSLLVPNTSQIVSNASYGVAQWAPLVRKYFPQQFWADALKVMWCESRGDPNAASTVSDARGLFQHKLKYWAPRAVNVGFPGASVFNPEANVAAAAMLVTNSQRAGQDPWILWACKP